MSLIEVIAVGKDTHLIPSEGRHLHQINDTIFCCCCPTAEMVEDEPDFPLVIQHFSIPQRKWGKRRVYEP